MRQKSSFGANLQRWLTIFLFLCVAAYLAYEGLLFYQARNFFPVGMTIAGVDVSGLSRDDAATAVSDRYLAPLIINHGQERLEIPPPEVGFVLNLEEMLLEAEQQQAAQTIWEAFAAHLLERSLAPMPVALQATHDSAALRGRLETVANFLDQPARPPQPTGEAMIFQEGKAGFVTDVDASLAAAEAALYDPEARVVNLVIQNQAMPPMNLEMLKQALEAQLVNFNGIGSIFVMDLQTGEEMGINADVALSGLSIIKVAIILETYRAIDIEPTLDQTKLISETAIVSGDFSANLLLDVIAGQDNAYLGSDILTESMHRLGLRNTFIAVPYEEPPRPGKSTLITEANSRTDITTDPDPAMQTTAEEIGSLMAMIYYCAGGGGPLLALYPEQLTPEECQAILDYLALNVEGNLIRFGVPNGVPVSHKHGWARSTHGDAGIVFSPGGDYIIVEYLDGPGEWLVADYSFPILRQISRIVYNFFNYDDPYLGEAIFEAERFDDDDPFFQSDETDNDNSEEEVEVEVEDNVE